MIIETKNDDEEFLSQEFKKIMLTENLYCVKISTPPDNFLDLDIPFEESFENPSYFPIRGDFINVYDDDFDEWYSVNYHERDILKYYLLINKINKLNPDLLIVKTGESTDYVREVLTNEKIPVVYYNKNQDSHYNFYNEKGQIRTSYIRAFEIEYSYNFKTKYCGSRISNFNEFNLLSSFSEDEVNNLLEEYKKMHFNKEVFKRRIISKFIENENRINNIILERKEQLRIQKIIEENKLLKIYKIEKNKIVSNKESY